MKWKIAHPGTRNFRLRMTCPHCATATDDLTVGPYWDFREQCWRCVICGFRSYDA